MDRLKFEIYALKQELSDFKIITQYLLKCEYPSVERIKHDLFNWNPNYKSLGIVNNKAKRKLKTVKLKAA